MKPTPWGDLAVNDAHVHFFSHGFFTLLAAQKGVPLAEVEATLGWTPPPEDPGRLAEVWSDELARHRVARAALIASLPGDMESVAAAVASNPDRFWGYFFVDPTQPTAPDLAARALDAGLRGLCFFPAMHGYAVSDARAAALIEMASRRKGTAIFVHCGALSVSVRKRLGLPSPFDLRYSNPLDIHTLAQRYPSLPFIVPHFGAGLFRETLMLADLCPNVYLDTSSTNSWMRYQHPVPTLAEVFARALDVTGPRRLLFGTDSSFFPRGWHAAVFDQQVQAMEAAGIGPRDAEAILGANLARILAS
jgi:hypothetical protein